MAKGVRGFISMLEGMGYKVVFLKKSVIAVPPKDTPAGKYGLKLKKGKGEVIFIRKDKVVIPARPYLYLDEAQIKYLRRRVLEILRGDR